MRNKELDNALHTHLDRLTKETRLRGAGYRVALCCNIISEGCIGTVDSKIDIQSITKLFTAVAILQLQEKGFLDLEDKVSVYLPEFKNVSFSKIKIIHLLTHTSGLAPLQDTFPDRELNWEAEVDKHNVEGSWIPAILGKGLFFEPGERWEYSKAGFCILGEILQRITGKKAEDYIRQNILEPCEMWKSVWKEFESPIWKTIPKTAWGLLVPLEELVQFGSMLAEGGIYRGRRILTEQSIELLERNWLPADMRDWCWDHGGKPVAYGAGCPVYIPGYEKQWTVGEGTIYHEGSGASMLLVNRQKRLAAAWATPFVDEHGWCEEAVKGTADVLWRQLYGNSV